MPEQQNTIPLQGDCNLFNRSCSVIKFSDQVSSVYLKKVTAIENNLNRFLWQGQDNSTDGSKVS